MDAPQAGQLLRDARWMAGLTQAEVAQRAGLTRQVVSQYEAGGRQPSVATLERLVAGCGYRLNLALVPAPGLEDEPTRALLALPPAERLRVEQVTALYRLAAVRPAPPWMVCGRVGARLHGAVIHADTVELWFDSATDPMIVADYLYAAGAFDPYAVGRPIELSRSDLMNGRLLELGRADLDVRAVDLFDGFSKRAQPVDVHDEPSAASPMTVRVGPSDACNALWHPRDRSHLALQRALRLRAEQ